MLTSLPLLGTQLDGNEVIFVKVIFVTSLLHLNMSFMFEVINLRCH